MSFAKSKVFLDSFNYSTICVPVLHIFLKLKQWHNLKVNFHSIFLHFNKIKIFCIGEKSDLLKKKSPAFFVLKKIFKSLKFCIITLLFFIFIKQQILITLFFMFLYYATFIILIFQIYIYIFFTLSCKYSILRFT